MATCDKGKGTMIIEKLKVYHGLYMNCQRKRPIMLDTGLRSGDFVNGNVFRKSPSKLFHFSLLVTGIIIPFYWVKYDILICLHCIKIK